MPESKAVLVAPCGVYCGVCSGYLALKGQIPRRRGKVTYCSGCRHRNKQCAFLKAKCQALREGGVEYCYECPDFPCPSLSRIDQRYRKDYGASLLANLDIIRDQGTAALAAAVEKEFRCPRCGGTICIHNGICYDCESDKLAGDFAWGRRESTGAKPEAKE